MFDQAIIVASIPSRWLLNPSYMHTFGITENYFIIIEQPLAVSLATVVSCKMKQQPMRAALKWYEKENVSQVYKRILLIFNKRAWRDISSFYRDRLSYTWFREIPDCWRGHLFQRHSFISISSINSKHVIVITWYWTSAAIAMPRC